MAGRRACLSCGRTYHIKTLKPKTEGICDYCNSNLVLRDDDKPDTVKKRLAVYHEQTQPLLEYYDKKGILYNVDGTGGIDKIYNDIIRIIEA
jgi:adenylate kinase